MIFDIKMGENVRRKARTVAGWHRSETPTVLTCASVVSTDSVYLALMSAVLINLKVLTCNIQNAYLMVNVAKRFGLRLDLNSV